MTDPPVASRCARRVADAICGMMFAGALGVTHLPSLHLPDLPEVPLADKILHGVGYFVLAIALTVTLKLHALAGWRRIGAVLVAMALYGAFDELTQPMFNRTASWGDWFADIIGVVVGVTVCQTALRIRARNRLSPAPGTEDS